MKFGRGHLIGDPHLGRKFEVGVPPHRRGEREARQLAKFKAQLAAPGSMIVMVGDLFENPYVPHAVVKQAIDAVLEAAAARLQTTFVMMAGNHDMPRKITARGAFDVFDRAVDGRFPNVHVVTEPQIIDGVAFFPWEWGVPTVEQVLRLAELFNGQIEAAVGHWDLTSYGGDDSHLAPTAALRNAFGPIPIYSGHYHTPGDYTVDGVTVHCTGSLEPYSHGEDPEGQIYVTMTLDEALVADVRDKCVRVILQPGEEKPQLDALAVIGQLAPRVEATQAETLSLDKFDWASIVGKALSPLDPEVRGFIQERLPSHENYRDSDQAD